jgi:hypothetical protein
MFQEFPPRFITCPFHKGKIRKATISCIKRCYAPKKEQNKKYSSHICLMIRKELINEKKWQ